MTTAIRFEWDPRKSESNRRKHGIDFEDAKQVFSDPLTSTGIEGDDHGEVRWQTIGEIKGILVVVVSHTLREAISEEEEKTEIVRIISARKASRRERQEFEGTP